MSSYRQMSFFGSFFKNKYLFFLFCLFPFTIVSAIESKIYPFIECVFGDGRSYKGGYQSMGAVVPFGTNYTTDYFFFDVEARRLNNGKLSGNYGLGWRSFVNDCHEMLGLNIFYDYRRLSGKNLNQLGFGIELLSSNWDVRMNGYLPIGRKTVFKNEEKIIFPIDGFTIFREKKHASMWGMDIEVGKNFTYVFNENCCWELYLGAGPYFYRTLNSRGCRETLLGGLARASFCFFDYINVNFSVTYDDYFKTKAQAAICLTIPFGPNCDNCDACFIRVVRNPVIIAAKTCRLKNISPDF